MPIDPQAQQVLDQIAEQMAAAPQPDHPPSDAERIAGSRAAMADAARMSGEREEVAHVEDRVIEGGGPGVRVRIYRPSGARAALLWLHGGSFVAGDLDTHDIPLRAIANRACVMVIAVAWRLAPEQPFPAGLDDAQSALRWAAGPGAAELGFDPARVYVGGDSAGGAVAAALALRARDEGGPRIAGQLLVYPNTDLSGHGKDYPSWAEHDGKVLVRAEMEKNFALYARGADLDDPLVSPIRADLGGLPPALVVTGEVDPQRDEGETFARRLSEAGVAVDCTRYPGMIHGFLQMAGAIDAGAALINQIGRWIASRN